MKIIILNLVTRMLGKCSHWEEVSEVLCDCQHDLEVTQVPQLESVVTYSRAQGRNQFWIWNHSRIRMRKSYRSPGPTTPTLLPRDSGFHWGASRRQCGCTDLLVRRASGRRRRSREMTCRSRWRERSSASDWRSPEWQNNSTSVNAF